MMRKTLFLITIVMALSTLASVSWAVPQPLAIEVIGNYWNPRPGSTTLCAKVCPAQAGIWIEFIGDTLYGTKVKAKPAKTNAQGIACVNTVWPQGIYGVKAQICKVLPQPPVGDSIPSNGVISSCYAAVSVYNPYNFCGAQGGGALYLRSYGVPPNVKTTLTERKATYAFIYKSIAPWNFGIGYLDNDYPCGKVEFKATQWFNEQCEVSADPDYRSLVITGMGDARIGTWQGYVHYRMYADDFPGANWFRLELWDINGALLYQSAPDSASSEQMVFEGKNVLVKCANDGWPCGESCP